MRLGKKKSYSIQSKKYPGKKIRILYYEFANKEEHKDTILFKHGDIKRLIHDHLENESYNDKNMEREYSDFFLKLHNLKSLLRKIEEEHYGRIKGGL